MTSSVSLRRLGIALSVLVLVTAGESTVPSMGAAPDAGPTLAVAAQRAHAPKIILGAVGAVGVLASKVGHRLAHHYYRDFGHQVPGGRMITAGSNLPWAAVAAMKPGTPIYADVARWGRTLARRDRPVLFAYSHEPEITSKRVLGGAADFQRAFRKVVSVMRSHGATRVRYTWQMTGWSFRVATTSPMYAPKWYPGDRYVDVVGPDEYNWFTCGEGVGNWKPLGVMARPALAFAARHHKKFAIPEFASFRGGDRRARWLRSAHHYLGVHRDRILAAFYFQHPPTNPANQDCRWKLDRSMELRTFGDMARHERLFRQ